MQNCDKSYINILSSSKDSIYCFYNISPSCQHEYDGLHGNGAWNRSKTVLKLFYIIEGVQVEKKRILTDNIADNWYITLDDSDVELFVQVGKTNEAGEYLAIAASNILTIPRSYCTLPTESYYINIDSPPVPFSLESPPGVTVVNKNKESQNFIRKFMQSRDIAPGSSW